jgi:excisionase family DNA binding protein
LLKSFVVANLNPSKTTADDLRAMGLLDTATYTQLQAADAMRDAAQNPSGGAGLTAGIGAGMGIGNLMNQSLTGSQQQSQSDAGGAAPSIPDVMTPSEAAAFLKVSEEDIVAAIEAGDLKARKLGSAFRISKSAIEEFLNG